MVNEPPEPSNTQPESVDCTEPVQLINCGASVSFIITSNEQVCTGFIPSSYSKVLVVVPTGNVLPLGRPAVCVTVPALLYEITIIPLPELTPLLVNPLVTPPTYDSPPPPPPPPPFSLPA